MIRSTRPAKNFIRGTLDNLISVIIPARNEPHLNETVRRAILQADHLVEVLVVLDGPTDYPIQEYEGLRIFHNLKPTGMRNCINDAAGQARGKYFLKLDAHCLLGQGYDSILKREYEEGSVFTARRYNLDLDGWNCFGDPVDYFYLNCPWTHKRYSLQSMPWVRRTKERKNIPVDDQMTIHGGMWFMSAEHFSWLGGLDPFGYGQFAGEPQEICMKTWMGGRKVRVTKNTWYAHPRPDGYERGYHLDYWPMMEGLSYAGHYWTENLWNRREHDFDWLIEKFWPLPTLETLARGEKYYWDEKWRDQYDSVVRSGLEVRNRQMQGDQAPVH